MSDFEILVLFVLVSLILWVVAIIDVIINFKRNTHNPPMRYLFISIPIFGPLFYFYTKKQSLKKR